MDNKKRFGKIYKENIMLSDKSNKPNLLIHEKIINLIVEKRLEFEDKSKNRSSRTRMKNKIMRCKELFDRYKDRLSYFRFYISHLEEMSQANYNLWLEEVDKIINDRFKENEGCQFIYQRTDKAGEKCRWINCPYPHHKTASHNK